MIRVDIPKFRVPFRLSRTGQQAAVVEQDSPEEVAQCVEAIMRTQEGVRLYEPSFGIVDLTFDEGRLPINQLEAAVEEWEPRASAELSEDEIVDLARRVNVDVEIRKEADRG